MPYLELPDGLSLYYTDDGTVVRVSLLLAGVFSRYLCALDRQYSALKVPEERDVGARLSPPLTRPARAHIGQTGAVDQGRASQQANRIMGHPNMWLRRPRSVPLARLASPPVSVVAPDAAELGRAAARTMLACITGEAPAEPIVLSTRYLARPSCQPPPAWLAGPLAGSRGPLGRCLTNWTDVDTAADVVHRRRYGGLTTYR